MVSEDYMPIVLIGVILILLIFIFYRMDSYNTRELRWSVDSMRDTDKLHTEFTYSSEVDTCTEQSSYQSSIISSDTATNTISDTFTEKSC